MVALRRLLTVPLALALCVLALALSPAPQASASIPPGPAALSWAEAHATGAWYCWGGTGPCYDCSGLVFASVAHADHISLPRTTYAMLASWHLVWVPLSQIRRGDLLFFGSGHVEFATRFWHVSYGAQQSGTRVGWHHWSGWWHPTMAFRLR